MKKYISVVILFFLLCIWALPAQMIAPNENDTVENSIFVPKDIFKTLAEKKSAGAEINFYQDKRIEQLFFDRQILNSEEEISGYRVQVFSSNVQRTAKAEAFRIKALMEEKFQERGVYESYSAPFWKVRIGDFRTREEAQELLAELMRTFPSLRREMYIVSDVIVIAGSK